MSTHPDDYHPLTGETREQYEARMARDDLERRRNEDELEARAEIERLQGDDDSRTELMMLHGTE